MAAVATTARASDPAQTVTTSARAGDADPGRFARLLGTAQETAGGQPSTDPMAAEHLNRRTATPEQSSPSDKPAVGKPPANKQTVPEARQTAGPAENSAARKQTLPHASAQNGAAAAAAQTAEPQASLQPASGQSNAEPVPPAAPTVKPGVVLTQPTAEPAQGNLSAQGPGPWQADRASARRAKADRAQADRARARRAGGHRAGCTRATRRQPADADRTAGARACRCGPPGRHAGPE